MIIPLILKITFMRKQTILLVTLLSLSVLPVMVPTTRYFVSALYCSQYGYGLDFSPATQLLAEYN